MKTKKKILSMLISMGVVLSLTACGDGGKSEETTGAKDSISVESTSDIEKETSSIAIETMTPEPTTPEPTTPEPTTPEPTTPEPTTPEPTTPEPTTPEPTTPEPTTPEPTTSEPTKPEPTTPEPTKPEPTKPEPTTPEPTTPAVVVDKNRDKYIAAAKKAFESCGYQATAFDDVDEDGVPELIFAESMNGWEYGAYFLVYENGEYKKSNMDIATYEGMRLYKNNASGKNFGLEISEHYRCIVCYLYDFENLTSQELAYIECDDDIYVYKNESFSSAEQVEEKIFAEMEENYTYLRDMSEAVVWKDYDSDAMIETAYDNYSKSK